ncbi:MAG: plastocyanin/azurin family copper-binding protein [Candidatus Hodarchaeota archaeon]
MNRFIFLVFFLLLGGMTFNFFQLAVAQDSTPDQSVPIVAGVNDQLKYDKAEITVSKNSWINLTMQVVSSIPHDFVIENFVTEGFEGDDRTEAITKSGGPNSDGYIFILFKTPDKDVTVYFYCSVTGHRAQGMEGLLVVGAGSGEPEKSENDDSSTPGFEFIFAIIALGSLAALTVKLRKR